MKRNKKIIIGSSIALVLIILISTIVLALFTSRQEETAKINIGNLDVILEEDWPEDVPEIGIEATLQVSLIIILAFLNHFFGT